MSNEIMVRVEMEGGYSDGNKYNLLTSHNGYQWSGGGLMSIKDLSIVRDEINKFLDSNKGELDNSR